MRPRATINVRRLRIVDAEPIEEYWRPQTRADCAKVERPCPFIACRHNLYLDVKPNGNIRLNFPHLEPHQLTDSCSLDMAEDGSGSLMRVGDALGITREMVRQMEAAIFRKIEVTEEMRDEVLHLAHARARREE